MSARSIPTDLVPLPTQPYAERPMDLPLDREECRTAIWRANGNVSRAAEILKVTSLRLRNFIKKSPYLSAELQEAADQLVDKAETVMVEAIEDEDKGRKDAAARYILDRLGKHRGWGTGNNGAPNVTIKNAAGGRIQIGWADGSTFEDNDDAMGAVIEHE